MCKKFGAFISARTCSRRSKGTKRIAGALHKQDWRIESSQDFVPKFSRDRSSRTADIRDKQARPLSPRVTHDSRRGHPCSCQSRWPIQPYAVLGPGSTLFDVPRSVLAKDRGVCDPRACSRNRSFNGTDLGQTNFPILHPWDRTTVHTHRARTRLKDSYAAADGGAGTLVICRGQEKSLGNTLATKSTKPWPIMLATRSRRHK
jgi:hypothetical protein